MTAHVSIIMPVFNAARYLKEALESVQAQDCDFELLVHDDGSTDDTPSILLQAAISDTRVKVSRSANSGPAQARNSCLARASAASIAFMDGDDIWPSGRLSRQLAALRRDSSASAVIGQTLMFGNSPQLPFGRVVFAGLLQACLFSREAVSQTGSFDTSLRSADDFDFLLRFVEAGHRFCVDPDVAVHYRQHADQWTKDRKQTGLNTVRALRKSLQRRRQGQNGQMHLVWCAGAK